MGYKIINCYSEDADALKSLASRNGLKIVDLVHKIVGLLGRREAEFMAGQLDQSFENILDKYAEKIRKGMVRENNRIFGIYFNTNKMVRSMNRDMHYLLNWDDRDRYRVHPFFAEYELQRDTIMNYLMFKEGIEGHEALIENMSKYLCKSQIEEYRLSLERTSSGRTGHLKY